MGEIAILFIPFDATKGHNVRMAKRGVESFVKGASEKGHSKGKGYTEEPASSSTCFDIMWSCGTGTPMDVPSNNKRKKLEQIEAPGIVMKDIMKRVPEICDTMLRELHDDGQKVPDVIFLSELLEDEEKKNDRAFPTNIKCSNSDVNYTKDETEAGNRA